MARTWRTWLLTLIAFIILALFRKFISSYLDAADDNKIIITTSDTRMIITNPPKHIYINGIKIKLLPPRMRWYVFVLWNVASFLDLYHGRPGLVVAEGSSPDIRCFAWDQIKLDFDTFGNIYIKGSGGIRLVKYGELPGRQQGFIQQVY